MSISATVESSQVASQRRHDHVFYRSVAVALALTVIAGFGPTYYFRIVSGSPLATLSGGRVTLLVHVHAMLFTAWVLLFLVQTALVAQRNVSAHRRLGMIGGILAVLMVVSGTLVAVNQAARGVAPAGFDPVAFLMIPLSDMLLFGGFVAAALLLRANREAHKRLMLLAYVCIVTAAIGRLPGVLSLGPAAFFGLSFLFLVAGIIYDKRSGGHVHPVYTWCGTLLVLSVPLRLMISGTAVWQRVADWMVNNV